MRSNYVRGAEVERRAIQVLKKYPKCFVAHRTAGSHSLIDVFGLNEFGYAYFVQLKRYKKPPSPKQIERLLKSYTPPFSIIAPNIFWMLWIWIDRKGWIMFIYDPNGPELEPRKAWGWVEIEPCNHSRWGFRAIGHCNEVI